MSFRRGAGIGRRFPAGGTVSAGIVVPSNPTPTISSLSPSSATAGASNTVVTVTGTNFMVGTTTFTVNGSAVTGNATTTTSASITIPSGQLVNPATLDVVATNPGPGGGDSNTQSFTVNYPTPTITSLTPSSANIGSGNTSVAVVGTGFFAGTTFKLDGVLISSTYGSSTTFSITIPSTALASYGTKVVTAVNPAPGGASVGTNFTSNRLSPTLSNISPSSITVGSSNTTITCTGTGFDTGSVVRRNGVDLSTTYVSSTSITAVVQSGNLAATGTSTITVFNDVPGGGTSGGQTLTVANPVPTTSSLSATSGDRWFATRALTITGTNFVSGATVTFGSTSGITPTSTSSTSITFNIPDAELDYVASKSVSVTNPSPGGGASNTQSFSVQQPSILRSFLIADTGNITIATGIGTWANEITDDTTKKNVVQGTTGSQPTFTSSNANYGNKGTVDCVSGKFLRSVAWTTALSQPSTCIVVGEAISAVSTYLVDGFSTNRQGMGQIGAANRLSVNAGTLITEASSATSGLPKGIYVGIFNGASSAGYRAGNYTTAVVSGNSGTQTLGGQTVNGNSGGSGQTTCSFRMIAVFAAALTTTQMTQFAAYVTRDCGVT